MVRTPRYQFGARKRILRKTRVSVALRKDTLQAVDEKAKNSEPPVSRSAYIQFVLDKHFGSTREARAAEIPMKLG